MNVMLDLEQFFRQKSDYCSTGRFESILIFLHESPIKMS